MYTSLPENLLESGRVVMMDPLPLSPADHAATAAAWLQLSFEVPGNGTESLAELLDELGAQALTMQSVSPDNLFDQIDERPTLWQVTRLTALFGGDADVERILLALGARLHPLPLPHYEIRLLEDRDWNRVWMDRFQPIRFGDRLWVCPSWLTPPDEDAVNLILDPGMAFGTGTHPTTAMCLRWLDGYDMRARTVVDYGCGSGILAIAALRLGAIHCWAADIDPQCLAVTHANAVLNGVANRIDIQSADDCDAERADILLANILAGPLVQLSARLTGMLRCGGRIVLSGLLAPQATEILNAYRGSFLMDDPVTDGDWLMLTGVKF